MLENKRSARSVAPLRSTAPTRRSAYRPIDLEVLNGHLGYFLRRAQITVFQDFIRTLKSIEISPAQYSVLTVTGANQGLSQAELAATLGIERAGLARLLHRLEGRGLIQRLPASGDGRRHALQLTARGRSVLARAKALAARHEEKLITKLGAETHRTMIETLREI